MHSVELSTAVNATLSQDQFCIQCESPALTQAEKLRPYDATELNNDGTIKLGDVHYQT